MAYILGIDTGGTYTDGVIVNDTTKEIIAKAKALTTPDDLTIGIRNCLNNFVNADFGSLSMVSLSTTLATNTIVEGRGGKVGLIMIGYEPYDNLPTEHIIAVPGGHNIKGYPNIDLDSALLEHELDNFKGKVDSIAISGLLSIRNPEHELEAKKIVHEKLRLPVVCAHELTTELGLYERTVTAVLNARLLPVISQLIAAVKSVLKEKNIKAPLMIVKGDGSLMSEEVACEKPIETILSGPASSIIGSTYLTTTNSALVVDMGGTTTDIALIRDHSPHINKEGATVGGWKTRVNSAEIYTYGLGGDSYIRMTKDYRLAVGPQRVIPLSYLVSKHPYLKDELLRYSSFISDSIFEHSLECYTFLKDYKADDNLTPTEKEIIDILKSGPHTYFYLANKLGIEPLLFYIYFNPDKLINLGHISRSGLTPTDILHATNEFSPWDKDAAVLGAKLLAQKMKITYREFIDNAYEIITEQLALTILQSLHMYEGNTSDIRSNAELMEFIRKAIKPQENILLSPKLNVSIPIVGIGAPIRAWLPKAVEKLNTDILVPEHAEVANAVGAAVGKIMVTCNAIIKPGVDSDGFLVHSNEGCYSYTELDEAISFAEKLIKDQAEESIIKAGADVFELFPERQDSYGKMSYSDEAPLFIESIVKVIAVGSKVW